MGADDGLVAQRAQSTAECGVNWCISGTPEPDGTVHLPTELDEHVSLDWLRGARPTLHGAPIDWGAVAFALGDSLSVAPDIRSGGEQDAGEVVVLRLQDVLRPIATGDGVDVEALICSFDWPCAEALAVARCESGLSPSAVNGQHAGLFQIALDWHRPKFGGADPFDAGANVAVAYAIWLDQSWLPWSCKPW